jgi:uncharacterized protein (TIGR02145 family)
MKKVLLCAAFIAASFTSIAQVGVGTTTPEAALDVVSTNSGVLLPRVANIAAVTTPVNGMLIYDVSSNCFKGFENGAWTSCFTTQVGENDVVSSTGRIWMDRNLGATQVATSSQDFASYGDLYQWGRAADGHQVIVRDAATPAEGAPPTGSSGNTSTTVTSATAGHGDFVLGASTAGVDNNWTDFTGENGLWQSGLNDPCPAGYRIPTETELNNERLSWGTDNAAGAMNSPLKLTVAGFRDHSDGALYDVGSTGNYWTSTVSSADTASSTDTTYLYFNSSFTDMDSFYRAEGHSVRCIKD